jgi:hypothetical protein
MPAKLLALADEVSKSAISSGVSPTRLRRGATGTPALFRRAIAGRVRPPCAIGIEAKSCSEFRAEEVLLLILGPPIGEIATMAATNKCLAQSNKSPHRANATKKRTRRPSTGAVRRRDRSAHRIQTEHWRVR